MVRVSYNFTGTLEMPDLRDYNLANASEKLEIERLAGLFDVSAGDNMGNIINSYSKKYVQIRKGVDTNWLVLPLRNSFDHKHSVYVEGGTQNLRYGVDASYNGTIGVMKGSSRDRYSVGFSFKKKIQCLLLIRNQLNHPMAHSVITRACNLMILLMKMEY